MDAQAEAEERSVAPLGQGSPAEGLVWEHRDNTKEHAVGDCRAHSISTVANGMLASCSNA